MTYLKGIVSSHTNGTISFTNIFLAFDSPLEAGHIVHNTCIINEVRFLIFVTKHENVLM